MTTRKISKADFASWLFLLFIFFAFVSASCNTRIEGCLDAQANNFDLDAELACKDCCTYPSAGLVLTQRWQDRNFTNADTLFDQNMQSYRIEDLKYFLSSWTWKDAADMMYTVDSARVDCEDEVLVYAPDNVLIDSRQFVYTMGTIRNSPEITDVHFAFGLRQDFSCLDPEDPSAPDNLTSDSPLWDPSTGTLAALRLVLQKDISATNYDTLYMHFDQSFELPYPLSFIKGTDSQFELSVDYSAWFSAVDVANLASFEISIRDNLSGSIFPTP